VSWADARRRLARPGRVGDHVRMARPALMARNSLARACSLAATLIRLFTGVIAAIILLYAIFVLFEANPGNPMVTFSEGVRSSFGWFTEHLFSTSKPKYGEAINAAIAAIIYVVGGNVASKLILRFAPSLKK
jgi:hypothetical protein